MIDAYSVIPMFHGYIPIKIIKTDPAETHPYHSRRAKEWLKTPQYIKVPSGKLTELWKISIFHGKTHNISMVIFNGKLRNDRRGYPIHNPLNHYKVP